MSGLPPQTSSADYRICSALRSPSGPRLSGQWTRIGHPLRCAHSRRSLWSSWPSSPEIYRVRPCPSRGAAAGPPRPPLAQSANGRHARQLLRASRETRWTGFRLGQAKVLYPVAERSESPQCELGVHPGSTTGTGLASCAGRGRTLTAASRSSCTEVGAGGPAAEDRWIAAVVPWVFGATGASRAAEIGVTLGTPCAAEESGHAGVYMTGRWPVLGV